MSMIEFPTQKNTEKTLNFESKVQQLAKDHHHVTQEHNVASTRKRQGKKRNERTPGRMLINDYIF